MEKVSVQMEVAKEIYELTQGISSFIALAKKEIDDNGGWSLGDDLPGLITAAAPLLQAIKGIDKIKDELAEDKVAFVKGLVAGIADLAEIFTKKD
jgi:hypothetical protein